MTSPSLHVGPSSWDRDMQGLDEDVESENLAALGMHIAGKDDDEEEEEEEEVGVEKAIAEESKEADDEEEKKDEPEELDELKELDRLEEELQSEEGPVLVDEEEV
ncbi:MAG TPA: hypothetical protein VMU11_04230 [Verrucomicrobiae bacterium]|nr:hypothetical protein [Verrucomicrobiae bacterium]